MAHRSDPSSTFHVLEITIISAQELESPSSFIDPSTMKTFAIIWVDPSTKLRTLTDSVSGENPTWNEKFLFRVPQAFLGEHSASAVHIEIYASGRIIDSIMGGVRFLVGNERLLEKPLGQPAFSALWIRRPSGRVQGVLNIASSLLPDRHVSVVAEQAIASSRGDATGYRMLMGQGRKIGRLPKEREALKERNKGEEVEKSSKKEKSVGSNGPGGCCGLTSQRRNLQLDHNSSPCR